MEQVTTFTWHDKAHTIGDRHCQGCSAPQRPHDCAAPGCVEHNELSEDLAWRYKVGDVCGLATLDKAAI